MFIIAGKLYVEPELREEFLSSFREVTGKCREQPGCLDCVIAADPIEAGRVNQFELWDSEESFEAWQTIVEPPRSDVEIEEADVSRYEISASDSVFS